MTDTHGYSVWASTAVGPMLVATFEDEQRALARLAGLRDAQESNGFGASAWMTKDSERVDA